MIWALPIANPILDGILNDDAFAGATVCAYVTDSTGKVLYERNGETLVSPASNEKLFSGAFALSQFGADYRPRTQIWLDRGQVVVKSGGDPSLSRTRLAQARADLHLNGNESVTVIDAYDPEIPDGWEVGDLPNRYAAPVAAFSVDQSGFEVWNSGGRVELRPAAYGVKILRGKRMGPPQINYDPTTRRLSCSGNFPKAVARLDTLAVPNATLAASSILGHFKGIGAAEPKGAPSYEIVGDPLSETLKTCLQRSDNNMAENLLLMSAAKGAILNPTNPYPQALAALREFETRTAGVLAGDVSQRDGSGLTRANLVTVRAIAAVLNWERTQNSFAVWQRALATPGAGTLSSRLAGVDFQGKTGSLSHVTALSGYLRDVQGRSLTVSLVVNSFQCSDEKAHLILDHFVRIVAANGL